MKSWRNQYKKLIFLMEKCINLTKNIVLWQSNSANYVLQQRQHHTHAQTHIWVCIAILDSRSSVFLYAELTPIYFFHSFVQEKLLNTTNACCHKSKQFLHHRKPSSYKNLYPLMVCMCHKWAVIHIDDVTKKRTKCVILIYISLIIKFKAKHNKNESH